MANPLAQPMAACIGFGETRTITTKDGKTVIVHRTDRPYVEDLCDAYNDAMSEEARQRGLRWEVLPNGELKLTFPQEVINANTKRIERQTETDRGRYIRRQMNPVAA